MEESVRMIKKYPNRRLYDTATSSYITLADVKRLVLDQVEFQVVDAKSNENLTRSILLQIILEEESGGLPMFSSEMLTNIIRFYGNAMQGIMGGYLEKNIQTFIEFQKKLQEQAVSSVPNNDVWNQFLKFQTPTLQGMMGNYLEQSANMFLEMQQQLQKQTRSMFNFGFPNYGGTDQRQETKPQEPKPENNKDKQR